jgi:hypothetical protein
MYLQGCQIAARIAEASVPSPGSVTLASVQTARAIHRAARQALGAGFVSDCWARPPFSAFHPQFLRAVQAHSDWPAPADYDALTRLVPQPAELEAGGRGAASALPRFVAQDRAELERFGGYERQVAEARAVPTRARSWHDFFNMAVWAHFPRVRWALNALHVDDSLGPVDPRNGRAPQQNVASQLDESGIVVASSDPSVLAELRALRFKRVFWERRDELLQSTRFWVIGHGTLESLLTPHLGLATKGVLLELEQAPSRYEGDELRHRVDARVATIIDGWRSGAPALDPVPLLGIPGYAVNDFADFYEDARYFRFERVRPEAR